MAAVATSSLITCLTEAREYYSERLARAHEITRYDRRVKIVFEATATHLYSVEAEATAIATNDRVERQIAPNKIEVRQFDLQRARAMDLVLPALSQFTVSTSGQNGNRLVFGPVLANGKYMKVVLRPGPGTAFTCVSAFVVEQWAWKNARNSKAAKFPP